MDTDETAVGNLYRDASENGLNIQPLVMDFTNPTPGRGIGNDLGAPATERLPCEMALAIALVHHLVFSQHMRFDQIAKGLAAFSRRWLLVEFPAKEDKHVSKMYTDSFGWYSLDGFRSELMKYYSTIQCYPSVREERKLLLCTKRDGP